AVAPRLPLVLAPDGAAPVGGVWGDATLPMPPAPAWRDALTGRRYPGGESLPLAAVLAELPVALLLADGD
ncbi:hypothetical protein, partial [Roseisolibacter sp. H3M3-2]|uniref:hypothetical protein n=1 Tax=Roseisolibacter sp. H3M3-2 TaxID=3031323 RepID=UPI0023DCD03E